MKQTNPTPAYVTSTMKQNKSSHRSQQNYFVQINALSLLFNSDMVRIFFTLVLFGFCIPSSHALDKLSKTEIIELFSHSKELFRQADQLIATNPKKAKVLYQRAIIRLEKIVQQGKVYNGKLFYNIGNIYFRMGDLGRAILNYRRAQLLIPNDINLQQNLAYARTKRIDRIEEKAQTKAMKILFFWHYDLSSKTRLILFIIFFTLIWIFATIKLFRTNSYVNWLLVACIILAITMLCSLTINIITASTHQPGVIVSKKVIARKGDSQTYQPSFKEPLHSGTEFILLESRRDWKYVELNNGRRCWLPASSTEMIRKNTPIL